MKIRIYSDVYNISKRIKNIDKDYFVVYDTTRNKFEIHNTSQIGSSYCLTTPYNCLDERTIEYVQKTRSTNIDKILEKIENDNRIKESAEKTSALNHVYESVEEELRR